MTKSTEQILNERASIVAKKAETADQRIVQIPVVEFVLFPESYAVELKYIREVFTLRDMTLIPGTPPYVMGVINFRGSILSVLNLKILFGLKEKGLTEFNKVIILSNGALEFGIVADKITGNQNIPANTLNEPPLTLTGIGAEFVTGITPEGLIFLNAARMLDGGKLIVDQK